jgi:hypothetical protein
MTANLPKCIPFVKPDGEKAEVDKKNSGGLRVYCIKNVKILKVNN